jgi:hypothetical protein
MSRPTARGSPSAQIMRADCMVRALRNREMPTNWPRPLLARSNKAEETPAASSDAA